MICLLVTYIPGNNKMAIRKWNVAIPRATLVNPLWWEVSEFLPFRPFVVYLLMYSNNRTSLDTSFYYADWILLYNYYKIIIIIIIIIINNKTITKVSIVIGSLSVSPHKWWTLLVSLFFFLSFLPSFLCCGIFWK